MDETKMSIKEAAGALGVSRNTIFNMADRGLLRIIEMPFGNPKHFVLREDVVKLIKAVEDSQKVTKRKK